MNDFLNAVLKKVNLNLQKINKMKLIKFTAFLLFATAIISSTVILLNLKKVTIIRDGITAQYSTVQAKLEDVLRNKKIQVSEFDYVSMELDTLLSKENTVYIKSAVPFNIEADGEKKVFYSYRSQVREAISDNVPGFVDGDRIEGANANDPLTPGMTLKVVRVRSSTVKTVEAIPKGVSIVQNFFITYGIENVLNAGEDGSIERTYSLVTENGIEKSKTVIGENIIKNPVDMVIERGAAMTMTTNRGEALRYSEVLDMVATCYTLAYDECGKNPGDYGYGITASGMKAERGVVAVNPNLIPYGTRLYIETNDGSGIPDYGYAIAGDTGNLTGNSIDMYVEGKNEAILWGRRSVKVYVLLY